MTTPDLAAPRALPLDWVKWYTDTMIRVAASFDEGSKMRDATLLRVDHVMDMVKAWKENPNAHR